MTGSTALNFFSYWLTTMRVLVILSQHNNGLMDPAPFAVAESFATFGHSVRTVFDTEYTRSDVTQDEYDIVIIWNALDWYFSKRTLLTGRPWVCACSFVFDDIFTINRLGISPLDAGLKVIFTSCRSFVERATSIFSARYMEKPIAARTKDTGVLRNRIGAWLPNTTNRDFSALHYAAKLVPDLFELRIADGSPVPKELEDFVTDTKLDWTSNPIRYYIPACRVTDIRAGIVGQEILTEIADGRYVLAPTHPVLRNRLGESGILPRCEGLNDYRNAIMSAASVIRDNQASVAFRSTIPDSLHKTPKSFCLDLLSEYEMFTSINKQRQAHAGTGSRSY